MSEYSLSVQEMQELLEQAEQARRFAYTPYSHFQVGAALLTKAHQVYTGCNIENAAFTPGNCAERTAIFKAVSEGNRSFEAIAITGGPEGESGTFCPPCGVCRQVMMEFCDPASFLIILKGADGMPVVHTLQQYLPDGFGPSDLQN